MYQVIVTYLGSTQEFIFSTHNTFQAANNKATWCCNTGYDKHQISSATIKSTNGVAI